VNLIGCFFNKNHTEFFHRDVDCTNYNIVSQFFSSKKKNITKLLFHGNYNINHNKTIVLNLINETFFLLIRL